MPPVDGPAESTRTTGPLKYNTKGIFNKIGPSYSNSVISSSPLHPTQALISLDFAHVVFSPLLSGSSKSVSNSLIFRLEILSLPLGTKQTPLFTWRPTTLEHSWKTIIWTFQSCTVMTFTLTEVFSYEPRSLQNK